MALVLTALALATTTTGIQTAFATANDPPNDLPEEASETGNKQNECGGSNEVKIPFESAEEGGLGTGTGRATGEFDSEENDHDDPLIHEGWPPIASECRSDD
ncbi:MAG: hypothetical protein WBM37_05480 [Nitrososphaeraceae archaeon]|jgi:hypothetical protein